MIKMIDNLDEVPELRDIILNKINQISTSDMEFFAKTIFEYHDTHGLRAETSFKLLNEFLRSEHYLYSISTRCLSSLVNDGILQPRAS